MHFAGDCQTFSLTKCFVLKHYRWNSFEDERISHTISLISNILRMKETNFYLLTENYCFWIALLWSSLLIFLSHLWLWSSHVLETHKTAWCPILQDFFLFLSFKTIKVFHQVHLWDERMKTSMKSDHWLAPLHYCMKYFPTHSVLYEPYIMLFKFDRPYGSEHFEFMSKHFNELGGAVVAAND